LRVLADTRLVPSPGKANAILVEELGKANRLSTTILSRKLYLRNYTKHYNKFLDAPTRELQYKSLRKLLELGPQQTYAWAKGSYTSAQIAGGGENTNVSEQDYMTFEDLKNSNGYATLTDEGAVAWFKNAGPGGLKSIDYDPTAMTPTNFRRTVRRTAQFNKARSGDAMSTVSQESNIDMLVKKPGGKYFVDI
jgi:hypothetical protein